MAKRFIDTAMFDDEWFAELSTNAKLFWVYYLTKCDHAGLMKYNKRLIEFQTGIKGIERVLKEFENRLIMVDEFTIFCPKFIKFQYPGFPNSKVMQQIGAVKLLEAKGINPNTLQINNLNSLPTVLKESTDSYGNGNDNGNVDGIKGGLGEKPKPDKKDIPTRDEFIEYGVQNSTKDFSFSIGVKYDRWLDDGWKDGNGKKIINWKLKLLSVIPHLKPFNPKTPTDPMHDDLTQMDYSKPF
jgi:hypothetical protein